VRGSWSRVRAVSAAADSPAVLAHFHSNLDLVATVARQLKKTLGVTVNLEELQSFGQEGLLQAARRFDPERGVPFRPYANLRIRGAIIDGVRATMPLPRRAFARLRSLDAVVKYDEGMLEDATSPTKQAVVGADADRELKNHLAAVATAIAMGILPAPAKGEDGEVAAATPEPDPEGELIRQELQQELKQGIERLPEREAELIRRHYLEGERFDQVARDLGLSKSWASRLHSRAICRLSLLLRDNPRPTVTDRRP